MWPSVSIAWTSCQPFDAELVQLPLRARLRADAEDVVLEATRGVEVALPALLLLLRARRPLLVRPQQPHRRENPSAPRITLSRMRGDRPLPARHRAPADRAHPAPHLRAALPGADRRVPGDGRRVRARARRRGRAARGRHARGRDRRARAVRRRPAERRRRGPRALPRRRADVRPLVPDRRGRAGRRRGREPGCRRPSSARSGSCAGSASSPARTSTELAVTSDAPLVRARRPRRLRARLKQELLELRSEPERLGAARRSCSRTPRARSSSRQAGVADRADERPRRRRPAAARLTRRDRLQLA